jgi:hypothetical protein
LQPVEGFRAHSPSIKSKACGWVNTTTYNATGIANAAQGGDGERVCELGHPLVGWIIAGVGQNASTFSIWMEFTVSTGKEADTREE